MNRYILENYKRKNKEKNINIIKLVKEEKENKVIENNKIIKNTKKNSINIKEIKKNKEKKLIIINKNNNKKNIIGNNLDNTSINIIYYNNCINDNIISDIKQIINKYNSINTVKILLKIMLFNSIYDEKINNIKELINNNLNINFKYDLSLDEVNNEIINSDISILTDNNKNILDYRNYNNIFKLKKYLSVKFYNLSDIINKNLNDNNTIIFNNNYNYNILNIKTENKDNKYDKIKIIIDNNFLLKSEVLLPNKYITNNYIDSKLIKNFKLLSIDGNISFLKILNINNNKIKHSNEYTTNYKKEEDKIYRKKKIFNNKIAFIGDNFSYDTLNSIINIKYISLNNVISINVDEYDYLHCESTWFGCDNSWNNKFYKFNRNKSKQLVNLIQKFRDANKLCIFYNKEDPTSFESFKDVAGEFDIIITTSLNCIDKYKKLYQSIPVYVKPFFCNPIKHNPINSYNKKYKASFIGGFYNHLGDRKNITEKLFDSVINNNIPFKIINRYYYSPKLTSQILNIRNNTADINKKYEKYNTVPINYNEVYKFYKKYILQLNINTVTNCSTMCSRRLIELLACGCNVYSNDSKAITNYNLPVLTDINNLDINNLDNINIQGVKKAHDEFSIVSFIEFIYSLIKIRLIYNIKIKLVYDDKNKCRKYSNYIDDINFNSEIILDKNYSEEEINYLIYHIHMTETNISYTNNKNDYYKIVDLKNNNNKLTVKTKSDKILLIPLFE